MGYTSSYLLPKYNAVTPIACTSEFFRIFLPLISYIVTNGSSGNGASNFTFSGRLIDNNLFDVTTGISLVFSFWFFIDNENSNHYQTKNSWSKLISFFSLLDQVYSLFLLVFHFGDGWALMNSELW